MNEILLPCRSFSLDPKWHDFFAHRDLVIENDWSGQPLPFFLAFHLGLSPNSLFFGATLETTTTSMPGTSAGEFVEGLWEFDVFELFLANKSLSPYQEFNVAPNGAWWTAVFSSYRKMSREILPRPQCSLFSHVEPTHCMVGISIPLLELGFELSSSGSLYAQACAILCSPNRVYVSTCPSPHTRPDFHLSKGFSPLVF